MSTKNSQILALALLALICLHPIRSEAVTSVSNIGLADGTYNVFDLNNFGNRQGRDVANSFTTGLIPLTLESITMSIGHSTTPGGGFSISLYSDSGMGLSPGTDLGVVFSGPSDPLFADHIYTASEFTLQPSTTYWIVASVAHTAPDKIYAWRTSTNLSQTGDPGWSIGTSALRLVNNGIPSTWTPDPGSAQVFSVQVIPEPSTGLLLIGGLSGLIFRRRQRHRLGT